MQRKEQFFAVQFEVVCGTRRSKRVSEAGALLRRKILCNTRTVGKIGGARGDTKRM